MNTGHFLCKENTYVGRYDDKGIEVVRIKPEVQPDPNASPRKRRGKDTQKPEEPQFTNYINNMNMQEPYVIHQDPRSIFTFFNQQKESKIYLPNPLPQKTDVE